MKPLQTWTFISISIFILAASTAFGVGGPATETDEVRRGLLPGGDYYDAAYEQLIENNPYLEEGGIMDDGNGSSNSISSTSSFDQAFLNDLADGNFSMDSTSDTSNSDMSNTSDL